MMEYGMILCALGILSPGIVLTVPGEGKRKQPSFEVVPHQAMQSQLSPPSARTPPQGALQYPPLPVLPYYQYYAPYPIPQIPYSDVKKGFETIPQHQEEIPTLNWGRGPENLRPHKSKNSMAKPVPKPLPSSETGVYNDDDDDDNDNGSSEVHVSISSRESDGDSKEKHNTTKIKGTIRAFMAHLNESMYRLQNSDNDEVHIKNHKSTLEEGSIDGSSEEHTSKSDYDDSDAGLAGNLNVESDENSSERSSRKHKSESDEYSTEENANKSESELDESSEKHTSESNEDNSEGIKNESERKAKLSRKMESGTSRDERSIRASAVRTPSSSKAAKDGEEANTAKNQSSPLNVQSTSNVTSPIEIFTKELKPKSTKQPTIAMWIIDTMNESIGGRAVLAVMPQLLTTVSDVVGSFFYSILLAWRRLKTEPAIKGEEGRTILEILTNILFDNMKK